MAGNELRIPKYPLKVVPGVLFSLAIIAALGRTIIRFRQNRRLRLDDIFVVFACACLVGATVLFYLSISTTYWVETFLLDPTSTDIPPDFLKQVLWYQKGTYCFLALSFTTIFSIKASFLCFFRDLTDRIYWLIIYWRIVTGITLASFIFSVCSEFISCPHIGPSAFRCSVEEVFIISYISIGSDVFTDLMSKSLLSLLYTKILTIAVTLIPVTILWKAKIKRTQKFNLATFLCLNVAMIVIASVRMSGLHAYAPNGGETTDLIWELLWQFIEACISVMMVSLIAFRTAFNVKSSRKKMRQWYSPRIIWNRRRPSPDDEISVGGLPTIPSAILTGMRTLIRGTSDQESRNFETLDRQWPLLSNASSPTKSFSHASDALT